jgi:hypothetical protein
MTAPATVRRAGPFNGNGVTTSFPFTFKVFATSDLAVTKTADGIDTALVLASDYSVTLNVDQDSSPGGSITYPISGSPLPAGQTLVAVGALPYDQTADLPSGGNYRAIVVENALDRTVMQVQQVAEELGRALTLPASAAGADTELPAPEAGKVIAWNEAGDGLVNLDASDLASVVVAGTSYTDVFDGTGAQTAFTLTSNPGSVNALDIAISGVTQVNGVDFTVSGTTLTFAAAPPIGAGNIAVRYVAALPVGTVAWVDVSGKPIAVFTDPPFGAVGNGSADNAAILAAAIASGVKRLYIPDGVFALASPVSATLTDDLTIEGEGSFIFTGANNTNPMLSIQSAGHSLNILGVTFDGDEKIAGCLKVENTNAMTTADPVCVLEGCTFVDFKMNTASIWNLAAYIAGSFERVEVLRNTVRNITRAAGTGVPGTAGTTGIYVTNYDANKWVRSCIHEGNSYTNITGGDLVASANNVDFDGFKFYAPPPTDNDNIDATVSSYSPSTCRSSNNTYRNVRGRAVKIQAVSTVTGEKIVRDAGYTITGGSTEINLQYGAGTVRDCEFFYKDYAGPSSPIQTAGHSLVVFFQGAWYDEDHGGTSVSGIRVYNNIKTGVGNNIAQLVNCQTGAGVIAKDRLLVRVSDITVNRGDVDWLLTLSGDTGADGLIVLEDVSVPKVTYSAIGTNYTNPSFKLLARGIYNLDGVTTPGNAKKFISDLSGPGADIAWSGVLDGHSTHGFLNTYNRGADFNAAPMLVNGALTGTGLGGALSVQTIRLADDASHTFERRFFNSGRGLIAVSVDFDYTTQGLFAVGSNGVYQIAAHASDLFTPSTTGSNTDTDGQLNLWFTGGALSVKNRLGGTYSVTVAFLG